MPETSASNSGPGKPKPPKPPKVKAPKPPKPAKPPEATPPKPGRSKREREHITDPERMRALAHPARMDVFDFLGARRIQGFDGATATEIAEVADMSPSAMSYHLRTLAKAGFIEEAPSRGDARERLWRLKLHSFNIESDKDAPESDRVAERAMARTFAAQHDREFDRWLESKALADPDERDLATVSSGKLRLRPEEVTEFKERLLALLQEYADLTLDYVDKGDSDDGTVIMNYHLRLFPHMDT